MKKIVINYCYGGFELNKKACNILGVDRYEQEKIARDNPVLVKMVEANETISDNIYSCKLAVVEIPDNTTDWMINEYDGAEEIIFVVDGKLHRRGQKGGCPSIFV